MERLVRAVSARCSWSHLFTLGTYWQLFEHMMRRSFLFGRGIEILMQRINVLIIAHR